MSSGYGQAWDDAYLGYLLEVGHHASGLLMAGVDPDKAIKMSHKRVLERRAEQALYTAGDNVTPIKGPRNSE